MIVTAVALLLANAVDVAPLTVLPAKPKMICKTVMVTGTRIGGKRECRSKANWDQFQRNSEDDVRGMLDTTDTRFPPDGRSGRIGD